MLWLLPPACPLVGEKGENPQSTDARPKLRGDETLLQSLSQEQQSGVQTQAACAEPPGPYTDAVAGTSQDLSSSPQAVNTCASALGSSSGCRAQPIAGQKR
jgi:hypothetical protein